MKFRGCWPRSWSHQFATPFWGRQSRWRFSPSTPIFERISMIFALQKGLAPKKLPFCEFKWFRQSRSDVRNWKTITWAWSCLAIWMAFAGDQKLQEVDSQCHRRSTVFSNISLTLLASSYLPESHITQKQNPPRSFCVYEVNHCSSWFGNYAEQACQAPFEPSAILLHVKSMQCKICRNMYHSIYLLYLFFKMFHFRNSKDPVFLDFFNPQMSRSFKDSERVVSRHYLPHRSFFMSMEGHISPIWIWSS